MRRLDQIYNSHMQVFERTKSKNKLPVGLCGNFLRPAISFLDEGLNDQFLEAAE
jgi:NAD-dependent SIR2 family protein deacetylase